MCLSIVEPARTKMLPKRRAVTIAFWCQNGAGWFAVTVVIAFRRQKAHQRAWKIGKRIVENDAGDGRCIREGECAAQGSHGSSSLA